MTDQEIVLGLCERHQGWAFFVGALLGMGWYELVDTVSSFARLVRMLWRERNL